MNRVRCIDCGLIDYLRCWELQKELFEGMIGRKTGGKAPAEATLILCEHPHVYTLGRNGNPGNMLVDERFLQTIGATVHHIDRGGDITYHGPGQLVAYPILDLDAVGLGIRSYIDALEQTVIDTVAEFGIAAGRRTGAAGVWLEASGNRPLRKICAIGVRASRGVTMHGLALNVSTRLEYFSHINPCGFAPDAVTSVERETGHATDMAQVKKLFVEHFERVFGVRVQ